MLLLKRGRQPYLLTTPLRTSDETGCFYRALPEKSLAEKKDCKGGKKAKERITISLFVNAAGGKEVPVVIGKSAKPRCFKGLNDFTKPSFTTQTPKHG